MTEDRAQSTIDALPPGAPPGLAFGAMYRKVDARHGRVDVAVNVAGIPWGEPGEAERFNATVEAMVAQMAAGRPPAKWDFFVNMTDESFAAMLATHLFGTFYCTRAAGRQIIRRGSGSIVNFGSGAAVMGFPGRGTIRPRRRRSPG